MSTGWFVGRVVFVASFFPAARRAWAVAAVVIACWMVLPVGWCGSASAQDVAASNHRLNQALAVLRARMGHAGPACLQAMRHVHEDEDQVDNQVRINPGDGDRPNKQLDIARDVLDSDYETATAACVPDARRVCEAPGAGSVGACVAFEHTRAPGS